MGAGAAGMAMGALGSIGSATTGVIGALSQKDSDLHRIAPPSAAEKAARRSSRNKLRKAGRYLDRGAYETNYLVPSLYELAGYEVEYDPASFAAAREARARADEAQSWLQLKGKARKAKQKELYQELLAAGEIGETWQGQKGDKRHKRTKANLKKYARRMDTEADLAESQAGEITALKRGRLGTAGEQELTDILRQRALDAARTGESSDPRLNRELAEAEGEIRARLFRQFGPDYENTTAGAMALNAFRQRKAESLADFARQDLQMEGLAQRYEAGLGSLAAQRMGLATAPTNTRGTMAEAYSALAGDWLDQARFLRDDRWANYQSAITRDLDQEADNARVYGSMTRAFDMLSEYGNSMAGAGGMMGGGGGGAPAGG